MKNKKIKLSDFFLLEADSKILDYRCKKTNLIIWPILREDFFNLIISKLYYENEFIKYDVRNNLIKKLFSFIKIFKILQYFKNLLFRIKKKDILFVKTGDANVFLKNEFFDKNIDYFISIKKQNYITLSRSSNYSFFNKYYDNEMFFLSNSEKYIELVSMFKNSNFHVAKDLTFYLITKINKIFKIKFNKNEIERLIKLNFIKINSIEKKLNFYQKLVKKIKPKLAIIECASYSQNALLNYTLHKFGVVIGEPQHGLISKGHENYNFSNFIKNNKEYRQFLPNHFLFYGKAWKKKINANFKGYHIGNPHKSESRIRNSKKKKIKKILFVSDGINIKMISNLAKKTFLSLKGKYEVYIRPHPIEKIQINKSNMDFYEDIKIDNEENVFKSLSDKEIVVGEMSTVLYESLGIVSKVFILRTKKSEFVLPSHPFKEIRNIKNLIKEINLNKKNNLRIDLKDYFEKNWEKNYKKYLNKHIL